MEMKPQFRHDCSGCVFVGQLGRYDIYFHPYEPYTIVARYSDDGPEYLSSGRLALRDIGLRLELI